MIDLFNGRLAIANRSGRRVFSVPTNGSLPPYVPTAIMVDADGVITGLLVDNGPSDTPQQFTVKAGVMYSLSLVKVTDVSGVSSITGVV